MKCKLRIFAIFNFPTHRNFPKNVSDYLVCLLFSSTELQLKARHRPYKVCRQWQDLLYRFTEASEEDISQGERLGPKPSFFFFSLVLNADVVNILKCDFMLRMKKGGLIVWMCFRIFTFKYRYVKK